MQSDKFLGFQQKKSEFPSSTMKGIKRTSNKKVGHYTFIKLIGKGAFSEVYLGVDSRNDQEVAIKMVSNDKLRDNLHRALQKEIEVLQEMRSCEYIVTLHNVLRTENNTYLVFEYCQGGDLHKYMKEKAYKLLEQDAQNVVYQLAKALSALRDVKIVHRDLKLSNILLSDTKDIKSSKIKLADFGLAKEFDHADSNKMLQTHCGTPINMAPQILERSPYTDKADLWSLGTIIYELVVGQPPYSGFNELELLNNIKARDPNFPPHLCLSPVCIDLICKLLIRDSQKRMTWDQFFKHPFVAEDPAQFHKKIVEARRKSNIPKRFYRPQLRGQESQPTKAKNMEGLVQSEVESNYEFKMRDQSTINQSKQGHDASDTDIKYYDSEKDNTQNETETNYQDSSSVSTLKMQQNFNGKKQKHHIADHTKTKLDKT